MKKFLGMMLVFAGLVALSGCSSSDREVVRDVNYLTDDFGVGVGGVPYDCIDFAGVTDVSGAYSFNRLDYYCEFDLLGVFENLYIEDSYGPINGLYYECRPSDIWGFTGDFNGPGSFDYNTDDICFIEAR